MSLRHRMESNERRLARTVREEQDMALKRGGRGVTLESGIKK